MSTEIQTANQGVPALNKLTDEQQDLIRNTVAKNATKDELKLFLYQCNRLGLDPLSKQVHFVKYGNNPGSIITGIDGFRVVAHRTGKLAGIKRGALKDAQGKLIGGWAEVYRSDWTHPAREEVPLSEYNKGTATWKQMPETMIKKVAEAAALRMAFPSDLSGVYSKEEMDEVEDAPSPSVVNIMNITPQKESTQTEKKEEPKALPHQTKEWFEVGTEIRAAMAEYSWKASDLEEYIKSTYKKPIAQLSFEEMKQVLHHVSNPPQTDNFQDDAR